MTTTQSILLDDLLALMNVAAWFATSIAAARGRTRPALAFLYTAVLLASAHVVTVVRLWSAGWWFVQEKVLLGLPLLGAAALAAVVFAGPPLREGRLNENQAVHARSVLALFCAGYAALAGLVVTFVVGYPLTWGAALVTIAFVGLAALLTARVLDDQAPTAHQSDTGHRFSRRQILTYAAGAAVLGAGGAGAALSVKPTDSVVTGGGPAMMPSYPDHVSVADLRDSRPPALGGTVRRHLLTAQQATVRLGSGRELKAWTYNGELPGPAITATEGDVIEVTLRNTDIHDGVTIHWHGYDVACGEDGVPGLTQEWVPPGGTFVYRFRADQVGTYWYHTHQASAVGVRMGLYGTIVVHPRNGAIGTRQPGAQPLDLVVPIHTLEDTMLIGAEDGRTEQTVVRGSPVRLRLVNTDSDPHRVTLVGTAFRVVAVDGRDVNEPTKIKGLALRLPAGGRIDVVFDMPSAPVVLAVDDGDEASLLLRPEGGTGDVPSADTPGWPELDLLSYGSPTALPFDVENPDRHFTLVLDRGLAMVDGRPEYAYTVNGLGHPSIPDQLVATGDLVRFTVVNRGLANHPWHLHGHRVLILSRDGARSSGSPLWVDTFDVRPGEVWEVVFRAANPGMWMNHCHNLAHADQGMMLRLVYDGVTSPYGKSHMHRM